MASNEPLSSTSSPTPGGSFNHFLPSGFDFSVSRGKQVSEPLSQWIPVGLEVREALEAISKTASVYSRTAKSACQKPHVPWHTTAHHPRPTENTNSVWRCLRWSGTIGYHRVPSRTFAYQPAVFPMEAVCDAGSVSSVWYSIDNCSGPASCRYPKN